jgi:hypothetical protein
MKESKRTEGSRPKRGYWKAPSFSRGGCLLLGPIQFNWFNDGFRVYLTWPGRTRTLIAR